MEKSKEFEEGNQKIKNGMRGVGLGRESYGASGTGIFALSQVEELA